MGKNIPSDRMVRKLWRTVLIKQRGEKCQYPRCSETKMINAHHIVDKHNYLLRYDLENGFLLCQTHHKYSPLSPHNDPFFMNKMITERVLTQRIYDYLYWKSIEVYPKDENEKRRIEEYNKLKTILSI